MLISFCKAAGLGAIKQTCFRKTCFRKTCFRKTKSDNDHLKINIFYYITISFKCL